jgi:hypothetical protein
MGRRVTFSGLFFLVTGAAIFSAVEAPTTRDGGMPETLAMTELLVFKGFSRLAGRMAG